MFPMLIAILIFLVVGGASWYFGFWNSLIALINLFIASLVASSAYHAVANQILARERSFILLADFIAIWAIFILTFAVMRGITDSLTGYKLKFDPMVEIVGRSVMAVWIAGVFTCFSMFTMQMAPLSPDFYGGRGSNVGTIPDKAWLAFIQSRSRGALSSGQGSDFMFAAYELPEHPDDVDLESRVFDPFATFLIECDFRRIVLNRNSTLRVVPGSN